MVATAIVVSPSAGASERCIITESREITFLLIYCMTNHALRIFHFHPGFEFFLDIVILLIKIEPNYARAH